LITDNFDPVNGASTTYRPNSQCTWIVPLDKLVNRVHTLNFFRFQVNSGDSITVQIVNSSTRYTFTKDFPPFPVTANNSMEITFKSDTKDEGLGFEADIIRDGCDSRTVPLTASIATLTDGSYASLPYKASQSCSWIIDPAAPFTVGAYMLLKFNYLVIGEADVLTIFDGDSEFAPKLGRWQGTVVTPRTLNATHGRVFIKFVTDDRQTGLPPVSSNISYGFSITYKVCTGKCLDCKPGTYYNITKNECKICLSPTVTLRSGQLECETCPDGQEWISSQECSACIPGTYSSGGMACKQCPPGLIAPEVGMSSCLPCTKDSYAVNDTSCEMCPPGSTPSESGASCDVIPVPPQPKNNEILLIYLVVGVALLIFGLVVFVVIKRKKSPDDDYESVFTEEW